MPKAKPLSKQLIIGAINKTKSNRAAARYLGVSYIHYKKWAKNYEPTEEGYPDLFEQHKNQSGKGIPKHLTSAKQSQWSVADILDGTIASTHFNPEELKKKLVDDENGVEHLFLVESSSGNRHEHYIKAGTVQNIHNILVGYEAPDNNASINIFKRNDSLKIVTKSDGDFQVMATRQTGKLIKDSIQDFKLRSLYNVTGLPFVVPQYPTKGTMKTISGPKDDKKLDCVLQLD